MDSANYELDLPRENIHIRCFAHNIMNYRYTGTQTTTN